MGPFFRIIRLLMRPFLWAWEHLFAPARLVRSEKEQSRVDLETAALSLYQFQHCPFCIKVRRELRRLSLKIELRDAQNSGPFYEELIREGGEYQTPCLKIPDAGAKNGHRWMYESDDIIAYLRERFAGGLQA